MNSKRNKAICQSKAFGIGRVILIALLILLTGGAGTVARSLDTGDPGTPFFGRVVNLFGYLIGIHPGKWPDKPDKNMPRQQNLWVNSSGSGSRPNV